MIVQSVLDTKWAGSQQVLPQPKDAADAELNKWKPIWNTHKMDGDIQKIQGIAVQDLPPITVEKLDLVFGNVSNTYDCVLRCVPSQGY